MASRSARSALGAFLALAPAPACLLTTSLDGFVGDGAPADSGAPADAGAEGAPASGDGGGEPAPDGASPAADAGDAGPDPSFSCATLGSQPAFCADFDHAGPINQGWDAILGPFTRDGVARSPPSAGRATFGTTATSAYLEKKLAISASRAQIAVDVYLEDLVPDGVTLFRLNLGGSTLFLRMTNAGAFLAHDDAAGFSQWSLSTYPRDRTWIRMALSFQRTGGASGAGSKGTLSLTFDGQTVGTKEIVVADAIDDVVARIGPLPGKTASGTATVRYDNVVVEVDP